MTSPPDSPTACARAFVDAVLWGEHTTLWELLSPSGRDTVVSVAVANGLDRVVGGRIRDGLADPVEREEFLRQLLAGLRRDLRSVELDEISVDQASATVDGTTATVPLVASSQIPGIGHWPAGAILLSSDGGRWRVDRLEPRLVTP